MWSLGEKWDRARPYQMYSISSGTQGIAAYTGIRVLCYQKLSRTLHYGTYQALAIYISFRKNCSEDHLQCCSYQLESGLEVNYSYCQGGSLTLYSSEKTTFTLQLTVSHTLQIYIYMYCLQYISF